MISRIVQENVVTQVFVPINDTAICHFDNDIEEWEPVPSETMITTQDKTAILAAKELEIENWKKNDVFEEIKYSSESLITTRWVITTKEKDNIITTKARVVAKGFEDDAIDKGKIDSPTCSKETLSLILSLLAMKRPCLSGT